MKVLNDYQVLIAQKYGGVSRYHCEIAKQFKKNTNIQCFTPVLFSQNAYYKQCFGIHAVKGYFPKGLTIVNLLNKINTYIICKIHHFDIIHPTGYQTYLLNMGCIKNNSKLVITIHDMIYEIFSKSEKEIERRKRYIYAADKILTVSNNTKKDLLQIYPDIAPDKVKVIYESATISKSIMKIRGLPKKYILYVGTRDEYKNFKLFFESIIPILENDGDLHLICVGGKKFTEEETAYITNAGLKDRTMQFALSDAQLNYAYRHAVCFVFPSLYEGFGLPVLEAMGNDCPCVLSDRSSLPEVGGKAAVYFDAYSKNDMYDKISSVINNKELREELIARGKEQYKKFSWKKTAKQIEEVYLELLS